MLFENRNNRRYRAERLNAWLTQLASLFTSMAATSFLASIITPVLDGIWPSNAGLWLISGVLFLLGAFLILTLISVEDDI